MKKSLLFVSLALALGSTAASADRGDYRRDDNRGQHYGQQHRDYDRADQRREHRREHRREERREQRQHQARYDHGRHHGHRHGHGHRHHGPGHRHDHGPGPVRYMERVRVTHVEPIIEYVEVPARGHRNCWTEERVGTHRSDGSGAIAGGIIGGVIGNHVGRHGDRDLATVAGVVIGAAVGNEMERRHDGQTYVERDRYCEGGRHTVREERISGYRVSYHHMGRTHVEVMDHDPGSHIEIEVSARL